MEFTESEIEMFTKAKELQAGWAPQVGDWFYKADGVGHGTWLIGRIAGGILLCAGEGMHRPEFGNRLVAFRAPQNYTWIPSAERLWEMLSDLKFTIEQDRYQLASIRLVLLGLVMKEKYQRRWDGKTWRKLAAPKKRNK